MSTSIPYNSGNEKFFLIIGIGTGICVALFLVWVYYIYSAERGPVSRSFFSRFRRTCNIPDDVEAVPLRHWPSSYKSLNSTTPTTIRTKRRADKHGHELERPKQAKTRNGPIERKRPLQTMCSKIEKNLTWQRGTLTGKSKLQSSLSTVAETSGERDAPLKIGHPIVHPNVMEKILETHHFGDRRQRQEAKRISEATFRFASQYKPPGVPPSPGINGGPSRHSITSPILFSPISAKSPKVQSRSSIITWFRQHPGDRVL